MRTLYKWTSCGFLCACVCVCVWANTLGTLFKIYACETVRVCCVSPVSSTYIPLWMSWNTNMRQLPVNMIWMCVAYICVYFTCRPIWTYTAFLCMCICVCKSVYMCVTPSAVCSSSSSILANNCIWRERERHLTPLSDTSAWRQDRGKQTHTPKYTHTHIWTHTS